MSENDEGVFATKARFQLVKRDAVTGEVFEVIEGGEDEPTVVTFRRPGQPPESYAPQPVEGDA